MSTILVTGAAGFIGSHVSEALLNRGDTVIGYDNLNDYYSLKNKERNLEILKAHSNFSFIHGDLLEQDKLSKVFRDNQITHVAHLAARAGVRPSIANPQLYEESNIRGTTILLDSIKTAGVLNTVITSSSSVYGSSMSIPFRENDSATDRPISPYAATKKATEVLSYTYHHLYEMNINVVRPFTVYGPRGRPDMAPWLFLESAILGKPIKRFGDGSMRRDFTYISDFVRGFVAALDKQCGYEIFNLGNSVTVALTEVITTIEEVTGKALKVQPCDAPPGDVPVTFADISKAKMVLGYNPNTSFKSGMTSFYNWYKETLL